MILQVFVIDLSALFDAEVKAYFGNDAGLTDWTNDNLGAGLFRFNGTTGKLEYYNYGDSNWKVVASDAELTNLLTDFTEFRESTGVVDFVDTRYTFASPLSVAANTPIVVPNNSGIIWDDQKPVDIDTMFYSVKLDISSITGTFQKGEVITGGTSGATAVVASIYPSFLLLVNISDIPFQVAETVTGGLSGATATVDVVNFDYGITGRDGDGLLFTVEFFVIPTNVNTTYLETTIDIGGAVGEIYPRIHTFPKGQGEIRPISFSIGGYTRDTWETNSGMVIVEANGTFDLYGVRHVLTRTHKAR